MKKIQIKIAVDSSGRYFALGSDMLSSEQLLVRVRKRVGLPCSVYNAEIDVALPDDCGSGASGDFDLILEGSPED